MVVTVIVGLLCLTGALFVLVSAVAMLKARDGLSRINVLSAATGLGMPLIVAGALVCAPAGAIDGTAGFLARAAAKATKLGYDVVAFTDRAIPNVALGRLRNDAGRWLWDLDATRTLGADQVGPALASRRRRRR